MKSASAFAPGKIILFGEHAVVYGRPAIAVPLAAVRATATVAPPSDRLEGAITIEARDLERRIVVDHEPDAEPLAAIVRAAFAACGHPLADGLIITITSTIPVASGLGSSAAVGTAIVRALAAWLGHPLTAHEVSGLVYEAEKRYHGTPSGIDNTVIAYERPVYFVKGQPIQTFGAGRPLRLLIADTGVPGSTRAAVSRVGERRAADPAGCDRIFDQMASITARARAAIEDGVMPLTGELMNENHALLREIGVSSPELDRLVEAVRAAGAAGAKMSGGGMGGNMIALVTADAEVTVRRALEAAGARRVLGTLVE